MASANDPPPGSLVSESKASVDFEKRQGVNFHQGSLAKKDETLIVGTDFKAKQDNLSKKTSFFPPFSLDIIYKLKNENKELPPELFDFVEANKTKTNIKNDNSSSNTLIIGGIKVNNNGGQWRKHESKIKTNWLINNKLNQTSNDKISASFKEILNKLNKDNFDKMVTDIQNIDITMKEQLEELSELILNKSICEQIYSNLYAKLCFTLLPNCIEEGEKKYYFRDYLLNKCQKKFTLFTMTACSEETSIPKATVIGTMKFIGELYNVKIIPDQIMRMCLDKLLSKLDNKKSTIFDSISTNQKCVYNVDGVCILLATSGKQMGKQDKKNAQEYILKIKKIIESVNNNQTDYEVSKREVFLMMDMLDKLDKLE